MKLFDNSQAECVSQEYKARVTEAQKKILHIITLLSFSMISGQSQCPLSMEQIEECVSPLVRMYQSFETEEYINNQRFNNRLRVLDTILQNLNTTVPHWGAGYCSEQSGESNTFRFV